MHRSRLRWAALALPLALLTSGRAAPVRAAGANMFATGLNNPRGLKFGPHGDLYVAEGGLGGTMTTTPAQCEQVPAPVGPYSGGFTARISRIDSTGTRTTVAAGLPSSQTSAALGGLVSGVADVAFAAGQLYALIAGAGCSHGLAGTDNEIVRVNADGSTTPIANLGEFFPTAMTFGPDGALYISNQGFGFPAGAGQIVRATVPD